MVDGGAVSEVAIETGGAGVQRRQHRRKRVMWAAKLEFDARTFDCIAFDVSLGGAKLRVKTAVPLKLAGRLNLDRFGSLRAFVVWQRGDAVGLRFREPPEKVRLVFAGALVL
jgi:hypothetical protein